MSINPHLTNTANGLEIARRQMVLLSLTALSAIVYRPKKQTPKLEDNQTIDVYDFNNLSVNNPEPTDYFYEELGWACVLWQDYQGGSSAFSSEFAIDGDLSSRALIEPYLEELEDEQERIEQIPNWFIKAGDWLGIVMYGDTVVWYEVVGTANNSRVPNMAIQYILNYRDILPTDPISKEYENREDA